MDVSIQKDTDAAGHQISKITPSKGSALLWVDDGQLETKLLRHSPKS